MNEGAQELIRKHWPNVTVAEIDASLDCPIKKDRDTVIVVGDSVVIDILSFMANYKCLEKYDELAYKEIKALLSQLTSPSFVMVPLYLFLQIRQSFEE